MSLITNQTDAQLAQLVVISGQLDVITAGGVGGGATAEDIAAVTAVGTALTDVGLKVAALVPAPTPVPTPVP